MFPYHWMNSLISSLYIPIHLIAFIYLFVAFNLRPSHNKGGSYLTDWYRWNCFIQAGLAVALIPEIMWSMANGWHYSVCTSDTLYTGILSGSVVAIWTISKISDLGETFLLIYDSRRPLPIHIMHHFVSLSYAMTYYGLNFAVHRWIIFFNLIAHVILYAYLSDVRIGNWAPCWASVCISQMLQLILPFLASLSASSALARGTQCDASPANLLVMQFGLVILILLFADFYYQRILAYRRKNQKRRIEEEKKEKEKEEGEEVQVVHRKYGNGNGNENEQRRGKQPRILKSNEKVRFEDDFPDLRSMMFSP